MYSPYDNGFYPKEFDAKMKALESENFDLKMKIHYLNEKLVDASAAVEGSEQTKSMMGAQLDEMLALKSENGIAMLRISELEAELELFHMNSVGQSEHGTSIAASPHVAAFSPYSPHNRTQMIHVQETHQKEREVAAALAEQDSKMIEQLRAQLQDAENQHVQDIDAMKELTMRVWQLKKEKDITKELYATEMRNGALRENVIEVLSNQISRKNAFRVTFAESTKDSKYSIEQDLYDEIAQLSTENDRLLNSIGDQLKDLQPSGSQAGSPTRSVDKLNAQNSASNTPSSLLSSHTNHYRKMSQTADVTDDLEAIKYSVNNKKMDFDAVAVDNEKLRRLFEKEKMVSKSLQVALEQIQYSTKAITTLEAQEAERLRALLAEKDKIIASLHADKDQLEENVRKKDTLFESTKSQLRNLQKECEQQDAQGSKQMNQLEALNCTLETRLEKLLKTNHALGKQLELEQNVKKSQEKAIREMTSSPSEVNSSKGQEEAQLEAELQRCKSNREKAEAGLQQCKSDTEKGEAELRQCKSDKEKVEAELRRCSADKKCAERRCSKLERRCGNLQYMMASIDRNVFKAFYEDLGHEVESAYSGSVEMPGIGSTYSFECEGNTRTSSDSRYINNVSESPVKLATLQLSSKLDSHQSQTWTSASNAEPNCLIMHTEKQKTIISENRKRSSSDDTNERAKEVSDVQETLRRPTYIEDFMPENKKRSDSNMTMDTCSYENAAKIEHASEHRAGHVLANSTFIEGSTGAGSVLTAGGNGKVAHVSGTSPYKHSAHDPETMIQTFRYQHINLSCIYSSTCTLQCYTSSHYGHCKSYKDECIQICV
jgi:hypothetical protein